MALRQNRPSTRCMIAQIKFISENMRHKLRSNEPVRLGEIYSGASVWFGLLPAAVITAGAKRSQIRLRGCKSNMFLHGTLLGYQEAPVRGGLSGLYPCFSKGWEKVLSI